MLDEQRVVPDAQPHDHVEVGPLPVEDARLHDGVAHRFVLAGTHLHVVGDARLFLVDAAHLARDGAHVLKPLRPQHLRERLRFADKAHARGNAHLPRADLLREQHHLLHPRQTAVVQALYLGCGPEHPRRLGIVAVLAEGVVEILLRRARRHAERGPRAVQVPAMKHAALRAAPLVVVHRPSLPSHRLPAPRFRSPLAAPRFHGCTLRGCDPALFACDQHTPFSMRGE